MSKKVELIAAGAPERVIIQNLFHYYVYEMSDFLERSPNPEGIFSYNPESLTPYWEKEDHHPYLIHCDGEVAGFVLIRKYPADQSRYDVDQFFVLKKFKGLGVGRQAFKAAIELYPGKWQVRVLQENTGGLAFWGSVVADVSGGDFVRSVALDGDLAMWFFHCIISPLES
ncbi:GNAT family N-acetyltransferase [Endozoicomonas arenosclerae]|uniref:GNAT family N-acetyltransferase n=1 Tax=Endozoicomonas arenosclerae TaxID=1633495 RepID=UPI000785C3EC|nr:GNAT family N-acetyltransferase [Endozoicomonas arenosclerae]